MARHTDEYRIERLLLDYKPSVEAWNFHRSLCRFRFLIWGIKGGKSLAGAHEFAVCVLGSAPGSLSWVVAPTYKLLAESRRQFHEVLRRIPALNGSPPKWRYFGGADKRTILPGGREVHFRSADWPDNLRADNVDGAIWFDECGFAKEGAQHQVRERVAATGAPIIYTTTPKGRNWLWHEVQLAGMPPNQPYGEYMKWTDDGGYFVSHFPTWHFKWVPKHEIAAIKKRMTKLEFEQEMGAKFMTESNRAFRDVEKCFDRQKYPSVLPDATVMGLDLARHQDWTTLVIMAHSGRTLGLDRWNDISWSIQRVRIIEAAKRWKSVIVVDKANVGSVIYEDLQDAGLEVYGVELNAPRVKEDLIQSLQLAFERQHITIPDPRIHWYPDALSKQADQAYKELCWYEASVTSGGRISYSAPTGLTDDFVMAYGLANWGRSRGVAGSLEAGDFAFGEKDWDSPLDDDDDDRENDEDAEEHPRREVMEPISLSSIRPKIFSDIFGMGNPSAPDRFWG